MKIRKLNKIDKIVMKTNLGNIEKVLFNKETNTLQYYFNKIKLDKEYSQKDFEMDIEDILQSCFNSFEHENIEEMGYLEISGYADGVLIRKLQKK